MVISTLHQFKSISNLNLKIITFNLSAPLYWQPKFKKTQIEKGRKNLQEISGWFYFNLKF